MDSCELAEAKKVLVRWSSQFTCLKQTVAEYA